MPLFRIKEPVEAIRFTGNNHDELAEFSDHTCKILHPDGAEIEGEDDATELWPGWWLVRNDDGSYSGYSPETMAREFEPVEPAKPDVVICAPLQRLHTALKYDGTNQEELKKFAEASGLAVEEGELILLMTDYRVRVTNGDWLVRYPGGDLQAFDEEGFNARFNITKVLERNS